MDIQKLAQLLDKAEAGDLLACADLATQAPALGRKVIALTTELDALVSPGDGAITDKERLDFLDACNAALNARSGTVYGWTMVMNHNVNRLMTEKGHLAVDLNDAEARGAPSCRIAIDREIIRVAAERASRIASPASEGGA